MYFTNRFKDTIRVRAIDTYTGVVLRVNSFIAGNILIKYSRDQLNNLTEFYGNSEI